MSGSAEIALPFLATGSAKCKSLGHFSVDGSGLSWNSGVKTLGREACQHTSNFGSHPVKMWLSGWLAGGKCGSLYCACLIGTVTKWPTRGKDDALTKTVSHDSMQPTSEPVMHLCFSGIKSVNAACRLRALQMGSASSLIMRQLILHDEQRSSLTSCQNGWHP